MNQEIADKARKILALTTSPNEGEAAAAMAALQRLMEKHNLEIADLELKGHAKSPGVTEDKHDLGKAAFQWKLNLAEAVAEHFFCVALINRNKQVSFAGRPDNVAAMKSLYAWMIEQIRQICSARRKEHIAENPDDHIDPLRWQVQFGLGIVSRLKVRLAELKERQQSDVGSALIIHHETEISDYLEEKYGYRTDGKPTKWQREMAERRQQRQHEMDVLRENDLEAFYEKYPWERPETEADKAKREAKEAKERAKRDAAWERKWERDQQRMAEKMANMSPEERRALEQSATAREAGRASAKDINLEPFLPGSDAPHGTTRI